jgi:hypothetical protein
VAELDGTWSVQRLSGALPPMVGVRKQISGASGRTLAGPVPLPFEVRDRSLRYRFPPGLVDHVEPAGEGVFRGRATLFGRELGRFLMTREGD